jgi:hypothetical protein
MSPGGTIRAGSLYADLWVLTLRLAGGQVYFDFARLFCHAPMIGLARSSINPEAGKVQNKNYNSENSPDWSCYIVPL